MYRITISLAISFVLIFTSCEKEVILELNIDGKYTGIFERDNNIANVEIEFVNKTFLGNCTGDGYSIPIYHGEYSINGDVIEFDNKQLVLPAIYDPSTLLDGKWNLTFDKNILTMIKSNGDKYVLLKI